MDQNKLYVGNLPWSVTSDTLHEMFAEFGEIVEATLISDRETGRSKGFGFVTFATPEAAQNAINAMSDKEVEGRKLVVNAARPREERSNNRGGGGFNRRSDRRY